MEPRGRILRRAFAFAVAGVVLTAVVVGVVMFVNAGPEPEVRSVDPSRSVEEFRSTRDCDQLTELIFELRLAGLDARSVLEAYSERATVVGCRFQG